MRKFWIQNNFCAISEILTKQNSDLKQINSYFYRLIVASNPKKLAPSFAKWPKMGPDSSQVASSGPSNPNWLNRYYNCLYIDHFQNLWVLLIKWFKFGSESFNQESHFVLQISWTPYIVQKWFCIQNLHMDLNF